MTARRLRRSLHMGVLFVFLLTAAACDTTAANVPATAPPISVSVGYKPPFLPVKFSIDNEGHISISGETSIVTPVGEFSVGVGYTINPDPSYLTVIIRDQRRNRDTVYYLNRNDVELVAVTNGTTVTRITNKQVLIDATNVQNVEFRSADTTTIQSGGGSTNVPPSTQAPPGQSSGGSKSIWRVQVYNMDDKGEASLNGQLVATGGFNSASGWVDITEQMQSGDNTLSFRALNEGGGYAWGFAVQYGDQVVWSSEAGRMGFNGANNDDQSRPNQIVYEQTIILHANGTITEMNGAASGNNTSDTFQIGATVEVINSDLKIHIDPGLATPELGIAARGTRLQVVGGPIQSDDRDWWQVIGWDDKNTRGWCSGRFLQAVPNP